MRSKTKEKTVKDWVKDALKPYVDAGEAWVFMPVPYGFGKQSVDFLVCFRGWFLAIETKRPKGEHPTGRQVVTMTEIDRAHGLVILARDKKEVDAMARILARLPVLVRPWPSPIEELGLQIQKVELG